MNLRFAGIVALAVLSVCPLKAEPSKMMLRFERLIIPEMKLQGASFADGLAIIRAAWESKYPGDPFPVIMSGDPRSRPEPTGITMELKNVPAPEALRYLVNFFEAGVDRPLDRIALRWPSAIHRNQWETATIPVGAKAMKALGLPSKIKDDESGNADQVDPETQKRLEEWGVRFGADMFVAWSPQALWLFVRNTPEEIGKIRGIVGLLDAGYTIRKEEKK